jgi:hypothetical protein
MNSPVSSTTNCSQNPGLGMAADAGYLSFTGIHLIQGIKQTQQMNSSCLVFHSVRRSGVSAAAAERRRYWHWL